jgi:hypothetical protein
MLELRTIGHLRDNRSNGKIEIDPDDRLAEQIGSSSGASTPADHHGAISGNGWRRHRH